SPRPRGPSPGRGSEAPTGRPTTPPRQRANSWSSQTPSSPTVPTTGSPPGLRDTPTLAPSAGGRHQVDARFGAGKSLGERLLGASGRPHASRRRGRRAIEPANETPWPPHPPGLSGGSRTHPRAAPGAGTVPSTRQLSLLRK